MSSLLSRKLLGSRRFLNKLLTKYPQRLTTNELKQFHTTEISKNDDDKEKEVKDKFNLTADIQQNFQVFRDEDSEVIFDVDEEKKRINLAAINQLESTADPYEGVNLKHGVTGVFDIGDLIELLKRDKAKDIFVAKVPEKLSYVDYIVIATGRSVRHISALAVFVRKVFKLKRYEHEIIPKIEGPKSKDWIALDLGNIALHIFARDAREMYDLESLWSVDSKYDKTLHEPTLEQQFQDSYNKILAGLQPADSNPQTSKQIKNKSIS